MPTQLSRVGQTGPAADMGKYVADLQRQITELRRHVEVIHPSGQATLGSPSMPFENIYSERIVSPFPNFNKIISQTLVAPQPSTDLLTGLSETSRTSLPAGLARPGDTFQLFIAGTITGANGQTAAINIGTVSAGTFLTLPIALIGASTNTFFFARASFTVASPTTMNTDAIIQGFRSGGVVAGGQSAPSIPFNLSMDQTFTIRYTTANLASITINELGFAKFG